MHFLPHVNQRLRLHILLMAATICLPSCALTLRAAPQDTQTDFTAKVVAIADGDTITVLDDAKTQHKIRLAGVDAPEKKQGFGEKSKQALSGMVFAKPVRIVATDTDRYGRTVADVYAGTNWINRQMVAEGWAWHYTRYSASRALADAQSGAQDGRLGLWRDKDAVPPWEFRRAAK